jgi:GNAT superfamily N-acetyltransferase
MGRLGVLNNRDYNDYRGSQTAFFAYFDALENHGAARALFDAAFDWARTQGLTEIIGPRGVNASDSGGILVEGFEHRPALGVPYNFPYYDALVRAAGFEKETDFLSGYVGAGYRVPERLYRIAALARRRRAFWIKSFRSRRELRAWVPRLVEAHRQAFGQNHTYYPPPSNEIEQLTNLLLRFADPNLIKVVMHEQDVVALILVYPDISAALQRARGRLWPLGWWFVLRERSRTQWANANGLGVSPKYQGLGADAILYTELAHVLEGSRFKYLDLVQADEANVKVQAEVDALGIAWYKRHRTYRRTL